MMPNLLVSVGRDKPQHCSGTSSVPLQFSAEKVSYTVNLARGGTHSSSATSAAAVYKGGRQTSPEKELNMTYDPELAKKCAFDARVLLNDMQGKGHINELKLLKAMQLLVNAVQALAAEK
jgi:hypothetical protein